MMAITADDPDARQRRTSSRLDRWLLRRKITPRYKILNTKGAQAPLEAIYLRGMNNGGPCADAAGSRHGHHGQIG